MPRHFLDLADAMLIFDNHDSPGHPVNLYGWDDGSITADLFGDDLFTDEEVIKLEGMGFKVPCRDRAIIEEINER